MLCYEIPIKGHSPLSSRKNNCLATSVIPYLTSVSKCLFIEKNHKEVPPEPVDCAAVVSVGEADGWWLSALLCSALLPTSLSCCLSVLLSARFLRSLHFSLPSSISDSLVDLSAPWGTVDKLKWSLVSRGIREFGSWEFEDPTTFLCTF